MRIAVLAHVAATISKNGVAEGPHDRTNQIYPETSGYRLCRS